MKGFLKSVLLVLFVGIIITSLATSNGNLNNKDNTQLNSTIENFEDDIKQGNVIQDGIIVPEEDISEAEGSTNFFSNVFSTIGNVIVKAISSILKFFSSILSKFIG